MSCSEGMVEIKIQTQESEQVHFRVVSNNLGASARIGVVSPTTVGLCLSQIFCGQLRGQTSKTEDGLLTCTSSHPLLFKLEYMLENNRYASPWLSLEPCLPFWGHSYPSTMVSQNQALCLCRVAQPD